VPETPKTVVPNVVGEKASTAVDDIESVDLAVRLDPEPDDRDLCRVWGQSAYGRVDQNATITLRLRCKVDVPDVTGETVANGRKRIKDAGRVRVAFEPGPEPRDLHACAITSQSVVGKVKARTKVVLQYSCPITQADVEAEAKKLAKDSVKPGEDQTVTDCRVVSDTEGQCAVDYANVSGQFDCPGTITVTLVNNGDTLDAKQNVSCN
jgi:hypothetical protein